MGNRSNRATKGWVKRGTGQKGNKRRRGTRRIKGNRENRGRKEWVKRGKGTG